MTTPIQRGVVDVAALPGFDARRNAAQLAADRRRHDRRRAAAGAVLFVLATAVAVAALAFTLTHRS